jgi:hypothetical protein
LTFKISNLWSHILILRGFCFSRCENVNPVHLPHRRTPSLVVKTYATAAAAAAASAGTSTNARVAASHQQQPAISSS